MIVYVISKNGQPLMPTHRCGKVRRLLNSNKAKVVHKEPFTIQLLFKTNDDVSDLYLGVDTGSSKVGCAVVDNNQVVYYLSETIIRNDISAKMERRSAYRRARRTRKLRYRKVRFSNRGNSTKKNRFSPTMVSKINSHKREIEFIKSILP
ncbi:MAG TPA: RRXRR domain-containing protein, partial [Bacteroidales bacterium]|nr:RRXRR domain-containing protein [Bacteroidales bacterium]